jgi:gamma-glutamylcyclotransferase (GGCT)/AIG2-like uncharacterized protein YtfP
MLDRVIEHVFFYGTLWTGTGDAEIDALVRRHCRRVARGHIRGRLYDLGAYPAAVPSDAERDRVYGMLFRLAHGDAALSELDHYENYDPAHPDCGEYLRCRAPVHLARRATVIDAWVYFYNGDPPRARRIVHGDYRRWIARGQ